jgi:hypothetical protein
MYHDRVAHDIIRAISVSSAHTVVAHRRCFTLNFHNAPIHI